MRNPFATPPPPPKDAFSDKVFEMDSVGVVPEGELTMGGDSAQGDLDWSDVASDSELATFQSELGDILKDVPRSKGKSIDEVIRVSGVRFDPEEIQAAMQREIKARESQKAILDAITEVLIEGEGARVDDLSVFEKVGKEDSWGLRKVKLWGKYNFIDRENRIICPVKKDEWFEEVGEFSPTHLANHPLSKGVLALVKKAGKSHFLSQDGELREAKIEEIRAHFQPERETEAPLVPEGKPDLRSAYVGAFVSRVSSLSRRFGDDKRTQTAFAGLIAELSLFKDSMASKEWSDVLSEMKGIIASSALNGGHKAHLYFDLMSVARNVKLEREALDLLFPLGKIESEHCVELGQFDKGLVMRITEGDRIRYDLVTTEGKWLYPNGLSFDYIGPFAGKIAQVRKGGKWNFIRQADGALVGDVEFDEVFDPRLGLARVRMGQKFNFMTSEGHLLSVEGFDQADDFDKRGQARVGLQGREFFIDAKGAEIPSSTIEALKWVQELFQLRRKQLPPQQVSQMVKGNLTVDTIPPESGKRAPQGLSSALHARFAQLLEQHAEHSALLLEVFGKFRKSVNSKIEEDEKTEKAGGRKAPGSRRVAQELNRVIAGIGVPAIASDLRQFVLGIDQLRWSRIRELPVNIYASFGPLISRHEEEEGKLIILAHEMERIVDSNRLLAMVNLRRLQPDFEKEIRKAELLSGTRNELRQVILGMVGNRDAYWKGGNSMDGYRPKSSYGRRLQRPVPESVARRAPKEWNLDIRFNKMCELLGKGDLPMVKRAVGDYMDLVRGHPDYQLEHRRFGIALSHAIARLQGVDPSVACDLSEVAIWVLEGVLATGKEDAEMDACLGSLRERRVLSRGVRFPWVPGWIGNYHETVQASEDYKRGMGLAPSAPLKKQLERGRLQTTSAIRQARLKITVLVLGLATASAAGYGVYQALSKDPTVSAPVDRVSKPAEPVIEMEGEPTVKPSGNRDGKELKSSKPKRVKPALKK